MAGETPYAEMADGSIKYTYADNSEEIYGIDGSYYFEDARGNWTSQNADGSQCSGDSSGNWFCAMSDGTTQSGNDWTQSPAATTKQRGARTAAVVPPGYFGAGAASPGFFDKLASSLGISKTNAELLVFGGGALLLIITMSGKRR